MLFLELIQTALGNREKLSSTPSDKEWEELLSESQKQAVVGIAFEALITLSKNGQKPPLDVFYEWLGLVEQIKGKNLLINQRCIDITQYFGKVGFGNCILKGQGNAQMYPDPLLRMPGDIDIWLEGKKEYIREYVRKIYPNSEECVYHIDFPIYKGVQVEVHYIPSYIRSTKYGERLSNFYQENASFQFSNKIRLEGVNGDVTAPTHTFNIVYQMVHILNHFVNYGIGMRQIVDYYYLLLRSEEGNNKEKWIYIFKELGLIRIAGAVMWLLNSVLGLESQYLIAEADEARGRLLLNEIMACGNMGKYDHRLSGRIRKINPYASKFIRNIKTGYYFPYEVWVSPMIGMLNVERFA